MTLYSCYLGSNCWNCYILPLLLTRALCLPCMFIYGQPYRMWVAINKHGCIYTPVREEFYLVHGELVILVLIYCAVQAPPGRQQPAPLRMPRWPTARGPSGSIPPPGEHPVLRHPLAAREIFASPFSCISAVLFLFLPP